MSHYWPPQIDFFTSICPPRLKAVLLFNYLRLALQDHYFPLVNQMDILEQLFMSCMLLYVSFLNYAYILYKSFSVWMFDSYVDWYYKDNHTTIVFYDWTEYWGKASKNLCETSSLSLGLVYSLMPILKYKLLSSRNILKL